MRAMSDQVRSGGRGLLSIGPEGKGEGRGG